MCCDHQASLHPIPHNIASLTVFHAQEMEVKYGKSKAELDELVSNMEGL